MTNRSTSRSVLTLATVAFLPAVLLFVVLLAAGGQVDDAPAQAPEPAKPGLRVYSIVLDGLMPHEVRPELMPNVAALRDQGTWYEQARAVFPAETIPNHVAMMTGVLPARSGIIGNDYWQPNPGSGSNKSRMAHPMLLGSDTLVTRLESQCSISTATVQSKGYLWGIFRGEPPADTTTPAGFVSGLANENANHPGRQIEADHHWKPMGQPGYIPDPDDHAIDQATMEDEPIGNDGPGGFMSWLRSNPEPPHFAFVNLGDIDRSGHVDMSGNADGISAFRQSAIVDTDRLIGAFVEHLKETGAWDDTVLIFTSDHGMDWSVPDNGASFAQPVKSIDVSQELAQEGYTQDASGDPGRNHGAAQAPPFGTGESAGDFNVVPGGGTAAIYVEEDQNIQPIAATLSEHPSVALTATREPLAGVQNNTTLSAMGMDHRYNGDIVIAVKPGHAVRDGSSGNPIPGNHGQPATQHSVLMVAGGHPMLDDQPESVAGNEVYAPEERLFSPPAGGPGNLSVAPTVAAIFGIGEPAGGYDGEPLTEAFDSWALAPHKPCTEPVPPPEQNHESSGGSPASPPSGGEQQTSTAPSNERTAEEAEPVARPSISPLRIRPRSFRRRRGAVVSYRTSEPATTTFVVQRAARGYRRGRRCVPRRPRRGRKVRRCRYYSNVYASFARRHDAGRVRFRIRRKIGGRRLRPGVYRMRAVARNEAGRSRVAQVAFRVKKNRRRR